MGRLFLLFSWFTRVSTNLPPRKFSACVALSTCVQNQTGNILLWLFFTTQAPRTVSLIHRIPVLKLSNVLWLRESVEDRRMTKG